MFITLNSFKAEENWEDIFLRGNWEEIDCSAVAEKQSVTAGYAEKQGGCPKSRIAPFAIVYFGKKYYLTVAKTKHYSNG